jgi:Flp pilus assembly protein TadD
LGLVDLQKGEFDQAVTEFQKALALRPGQVEAQKNLADAYMLQHKWNDAATLLKQVVAAKPHSVEAATALATALDHLGDKPAAEQQFARARQLSRDEANWLRAKGENNFAISLRNEGKLAEATAAFRRAIEDAQDFCEAHDDLGAVLWQQQQLQAATTEFQTAVRCDPKLASARNNLGIAKLYFERNSAEAIEQFRAATQLQPGFALAYLNLGKALAGTNQFPEAEQELRRTITLAPEMGAAHVALGMLLATQAGKVSPEARAELKLGLQLDPTLKTAIPAEYSESLN